MDTIITTSRANKITGTDAGGLRWLAIWTRWAPRVSRFVSPLDEFYYVQPL